MIYRKVYVSSAAPNVTMTDVQAILTSSRRNNLNSDLSGLLIHHEGSFFQVLEGGHDDLMTCYGRILNDPRHTNIRLLAKGTASHRAFPNWKMGYAEPTELSSASQSTLVEITNLADRATTERGDNDRVHRLIDNFLLKFGIRDHARAV